MRGIERGMDAGRCTNDFLNAEFPALVNLLDRPDMSLSGTAPKLLIAIDRERAGYEPGRAVVCAEIVENLDVVERPVGSLHAKRVAEKASSLQPTVTRLNYRPGQESDSSESPSVSVILVILTFLPLTANSCLPPLQWKLLSLASAK